MTPAVSALAAGLTDQNRAASQVGWLEKTLDTITNASELTRHNCALLMANVGVAYATLMKRSDNVVIGLTISAMPLNSLASLAVDITRYFGSTGVLRSCPELPPHSIGPAKVKSRDLPIRNW